MSCGIGLVTADVTSPYDPRPKPADTVDEAGGLRIVQQDDIARADHLSQARQVALQHAGVVLMLGGTEVGSGSQQSVQRIVNPLGDQEERRIGVEHQPPRVDAGAARIREQRLQHLGDATAVCGGVDVPHHPASQ
jgi:hypothetical protein